MKSQENKVPTKAWGRRAARFVFAITLVVFLGSLFRLGCALLIGNLFWHPAIFCKETTIDLGRVVQGETPDCVFTIGNHGSRDLTVLGVHPSCGGCVKVVHSPTAPISPGSQDVVKLRFLAAKIEGEVDKSILVQSNDPKVPRLLLRIRAVVEPNTALNDSA